MPVRPELSDRLAEYRRRGVPPMKIYAELCIEFDFDFSRSELELIRNSFGWKPGWRYFQERDLPQMRANHIQMQAEEAKARERENQRRQERVAEWEQERAKRAAEEERVHRERQDAGKKAWHDYIDKHFKTNANDYAGPGPKPKAKTAADHARSQQDWYRQYQKPPQPAGCPGYLVTLVTRLELTWPFTADELRRQFRILAKKTHPDVGGDAAAFQAVQQAYETLQAHVKG